MAVERLKLREEHPNSSEHLRFACPWAAVYTCRLGNACLTHFVLDGEQDKRAIQERVQAKVDAGDWRNCRLINLNKVLNLE